MPRRAREPLRARSLHGLRHRRRLRRVHRRRRALLLRDPRRSARRAGGAAALRRPDRLPLPAAVRRRARIGFYGFGAAAHILTQLAVWQGREIYRVHARTATTLRRRFARELGAIWAGSSDEAPAGRARRGDHLRAGRRARPGRAARDPAGGTVVCGGIHMSEIPAFPYEILWGERVLRSVANLTRADGVRVPRARRAGRRAPAGQDLRTRGREHGAVGSARRRVHRCRRPRHLISRRRSAGRARRWRRQRSSRLASSRTPRPRRCAA